MNRRVHLLVLDQPHRDAIFVKAHTARSLRRSAPLHEQACPGLPDLHPEPTTFVGQNLPNRESGQDVSWDEKSAYLGVPQFLQGLLGCHAPHPVIVVKRGVQMRCVRPGAAEPTQRRHRGLPNMGSLIVRQVDEGLKGPEVAQTSQRPGGRLAYNRPLILEVPDERRYRGRIFQRSEGKGRPVSD